MMLKNPHLQRKLRQAYANFIYHMGVDNRPKSMRRAMKWSRELTRVLRRMGYKIYDDRRGN